MTAQARPKGRAFEREFAATAGGKRTPLSGATGGGDVSFASGSLWADWSWELKRRSKLPALIVGAMLQAAGDIALGDRRMPAVAMREDNGRTIVVFYWDDLRNWVESIAQVGRAGRVRELGKELERIAFELRNVK
jgi:hypothetical protein